MKIQIAGFVRESVVDGPGIRYVLFAQGCPHNCPECHNPKTHDPAGGREMDTGAILADLDAQPFVDGVTFSGGEPFCQPEALLELAKEIKKRDRHLTIYSGFVYEELKKMGKERPAIQELLARADLLVDGPFKKDLKDLSLAFRGSANQRLVDLRASEKAGEVVLWKVQSEEGQVRAKI